MSKKLKPKPSPPSGTPGSGSGVIRFADLPLAIRRNAYAIIKDYPGLSLTNAVAGAIEEAYERRRRNALDKKLESRK